MYIIEPTQQYIANRIMLAQSVTGGPLNILALPVIISAFSGYPADFTFTDSTGAIIKALVVVDIKSSDLRRVTSPRVKLTGSQLDTATGIPIAGYVNSPFAGMVIETAVIDVLVVTQGTNTAIAQSTRNKIMDGIATLFQTDKLGVELTDSQTGATFVLKTLGERIQKKADLVERSENETLIVSSGHVFLPDLEITYFV